MYANKASDIFLNHTTVLRNKVEKEGGAFMLYKCSDFLINECEFEENFAKKNGQ